MRTLLIVHRYLGVVVGLVVTLWCLSGFVMMYRGYPAVTSAQRLQGLQALALPVSPDGVPDLGQTRFNGFQVDMMAGRPVLRLAGAEGPKIFDLAAGVPLERIGPAGAEAEALAYATAQGVRGRPGPAILIDQDQWTVEGASSRGALYRMRFDDPQRTVVYVAAYSGQVVQATDQQSRLWAWLGAVPHWLYPHVLRRHVGLWTQVVIWTSVTGLFLTGTGLYIGVARLRRSSNGRWSPYQGWRFWHHLVGLVFGLFTLTWVLSGLLTMTPWGLLESSASERVQTALAGSISARDVETFLKAAPKAVAPGAVSLDSAPLGGRLFVIERFRDGRALRLDGQARPAPLRRAELAAGLAAAGERAANLEMIGRPDAYYYSGYDGPAPLPVWRASLAGPGQRVAYLDAISGQVRTVIDRTARASRWIRTGLHDFDFPVLSARPLWDFVVLILLAGVTVGALTGAWLAIKRVALDLSRLRRPG